MAAPEPEPFPVLMKKCWEILRMHYRASHPQLYAMRQIHKHIFPNERLITVKQKDRTPVTKKSKNEVLRLLDQVSLAEVYKSYRPFVYWNVKYYIFDFISAVEMMDVAHEEAVAVADGFLD
jgi:hypothetical protein